MFTFEKTRENHDERSNFANDVCSLIWNKYKDDYKRLMEETLSFSEHFENHVRNIYECINNEIPLLALHNLDSLGGDNYDLTEDEYKDATIRCKEACKLYYE